MIQILGLLGMYFDAVVVEVKTSLLLFRLALAILCDTRYDISSCIFLKITNVGLILKGRLFDAFKSFANGIYIRGVIS